MQNGQVQQTLIGGVRVWRVPFLGGTKGFSSTIVAGDLAEEVFAPERCVCASLYTVDSAQWDN